MSRKLVIILDPAHGSNTPGKRSPDGSHLEYQWSRERCKELEVMLRKHDFRVEYTNRKEVEIGLSQRVSFANKVNTKQDCIKLLVSLHNNAAGDQGQWSLATGYEIFTSKGQTNSDKIAQVVLENLQKDFPGFDGYKMRADKSDGDLDKEANFTVLMGWSYLAILIEWLFMDNAEDLKKLKDPDINQRFLSSLVKSFIYIDDNLENIL